MKKILVGLVGCLAAFANAATLECEHSYSLFKEIIQKKSDADYMSGWDEIHDYIAKYDYTQIFNKNHPGKQFWVDKHLYFAESSWGNNQWISQREYNKRIKLIVKRNAESVFNPYFHEILPPKANVLTQSGEICVVPVQAYLKVEGETALKEEGNQKTPENLVLEAMRIDHIFVRDIKNNEWRVLEFNSYITDKDFYEFFPDLPDNIKSELDDGVVEAQEATAEQVEDQD
ncbi:hypothetical protein [Acinetobacter sp. WZC-1]|uniref:hypothetical protein n=1 Tax=Acinetobacter sp. WZC-1 TaxID=3459034 RepID=UPI00403E26A9